MSSIILYKRFLDDIFMIFQGTTKELHKLLDEINQIHQSLKCTMRHTSVQFEAKEDRCDCAHQNWIPFLDTSCKIEDGKIEIDLYKKDTDRNQYLLTSSCHPIGCTKNIPFSLGLRIVRICTNPISRDKRLQELKALIIARDDPERLVDSAISKAKKSPKRKGLEESNQKKTNQRKETSFCPKV